MQILLLKRGYSLKVEVCIYFCISVVGLIFFVDICVSGVFEKYRGESLLDCL